MYRADGGGQLRLIPEDEYDLVYYDDDDGGGKGDGDDKDKDKDRDETKDEPMEVENNDDSEAEHKSGNELSSSAMETDEGENIQETDEGDADDESDVIYIVRGGPRKKERRRAGSESGGSEGDSSDDSEPDEDSAQGSTAMNEMERERSSSESSSSPNTAAMEAMAEMEAAVRVEVMEAERSAREAAASASALVRGLVARTEGWKELRPKYGNDDDFDDEDDDEDKKKKKAIAEKRKKKKKKDEKKGGAEGGDKKGDKKGGSPGKKKANEDEKKSEAGEDDTSGGGESDEDYYDDLEGVGDGGEFGFPVRDDGSDGTRKGSKLLESLPPGTEGIADGDDLDTLRRLSRMRIMQDKDLRPATHGVELEDWEAGIDWEGGVSDSDDDDNNTLGGNADNSHTGTNPNTMSLSGSATKTGDYRPPIPEGGTRPKRPRTLASAEPYSDPRLILLETRNPRMDALDFCAAVDWEGAGSSSDDDSHSSKEEEIHVPLILQSSIAGTSVADALAPRPSRPPPFESHPAYQRRYETEMSSDITSAADLSKGGLTEKERMKKFKEERQRKREQMAKDKQSRVTEVMNTLALGGGTGRRITSSLMGPGGAERTGRPSRHALGSSSAHDAEYVEQLELVYNHTLVKPDLTLSEYRQFHRPRLNRFAVQASRPWQFQTRVITAEKKPRGAAAGVDGSIVIGSYHAMMSAGNKAQNKLRNEADLSPSMGDLVVLEYSEERPPLFMTKGTTARIVNYYRGDRARCPISAGGGDRPLRKRHGDKAAADKGPEPAGPSGRAERPPRLTGPNQYTIKSSADLIGIIGMKKRKSKDAAALEAKKAKEAAVDVLPEGVSEILHAKVHGPFIGEVEEGVIQTGLISNVFAAPMFQHESEPTDFLMILGQVQSTKRRDPNNRAQTEQIDSIGVALRPLPKNIYCVGQTEPRVKVFSPNTNDEKKFVNAFIPYQVAKNLERTEAREGRGLTFEDIKDRLFANTTLPQTQLRLRIKQVANFDRTAKGIWSLKSVGEEDFPGVEALGRKVSPEGVAAYESQCAAIRYLHDLGITELFSGGSNIPNVAMVMMYLNGAANAAYERKIKLKKVLEVNRRQKSPQVPYFERAFEKLEDEHKSVNRRKEIAKFIYEELQLSPWHLSGEFMDVHKRGSAMMKLTGIGDPSGLGTGYNFLREQDNKPAKGATNNDGALNAQIKKITGTQNDLRKLTMKQMASLLRSFGMKDKKIGLLKRWDRVHVIRDLSTKAASDGMGDDLERFARGEKLRLSDQRQMYKERIQEIWRRQIAALTADGNSEATRAVSAIGSTDNAAKVDGGSDTEKGDEPEDSDESDDDFLNSMEMELANAGETNKLLNDQLNGDDDEGNHVRSLGRTFDTQDMSKDARELAALQRSREEERAIQEGFGSKKSDANRLLKKKFKGQKCIRRRVTRTHPDGTQVVTFEFIVKKDKVDEIVSKLNKKPREDKLSGNKTKTRAVRDNGSGVVDQDTCVGHAMFEDEDNRSSRGGRKRSSLNFKIQRETQTRVVYKKNNTKPPKKARQMKEKSESKFKMTSTAEVKRKKKKRRELEEADLYETPHSRKGTSNRRERGAARDRMPHVILSDRFENIRSSVENRPGSRAFHKAVSRQMYPDYYELISEPINLGTIGQKNRKYEYKTAAAFLCDFELMRKNAIKYNKKGSVLAIEATEIYDFVEKFIEQNRSQFDQMEGAVKDQMSNSSKKKKSKAGAHQNQATSDSNMNTANVMLDGVETEVNLGANFGSCLGESDTDSDGS